MAEERLKIAVFIDFDNIQIGVKDTLGKDFDVALVLEALKERGEVVSKIAYGDWPRAGDQSRQMTQHAVQMVQRNVTPRGDKNGADINLALDALEMAFTRHHINAFAIVGGDSDFMALVEKLKQYDKRVMVIGGRAFTSNILQRNCTEFIAYENLLKSAGRVGRRADATGRTTFEARPLAEALPNVKRALQVLAEREVAPQLGLLKSTLLQLDSTFSERDYGAPSFLEFAQKMERAGMIRLNRTEGGYLVELAEGDAERKGERAAGAAAAKSEESLPAASRAAASGNGATPEEGGAATEASPSGTPMSSEEALELLRQAVTAASQKSPHRPLYLRHIRQALKAIDKDFDERRAGFHGMLDLLHQAQREGWLHLQRDRKGVWRMFPVSSALTAPAPLSGEPAPSAGEMALPASSSSVEPGDAVPAVPEQPVTSEGVAAETAAGPGEEQGSRGPTKRTRRSRGPKTGRVAVRKSSSRRKPKEASDER